MYVHDDIQSAACFDPNMMSETDTLTVTNINVSATEPNGFTSIDPNLHNHSSSHEFQPSMSLEFLNPNHQTDTNTDPNNNWTPSNLNVSHEMGYPHFDELNLHTSTTDLLTLLHLPRCSFASSSTTLFPPTPSISFGKSSPPPPPPPGLAFLGEINPALMQDNIPSGGSGSSTLSYDPVAAATLPYDPLFHLNLPPQPSPLLRDLMFQTLPHGYPTRGTNGNVNGSASTLFGGSMDHQDEEGSNNNNNNMSMSGLVGIYQDGDHLMNPNGVFEFSRGDDGKMGKGPKSFVTERQRRQNFNDKYSQLRKLIPTPTKHDRASIVHDAISYIHELKRTVGELKLLVEKKRISKERVKRHKTEDDPSVNGSEHQAIGVDGPGLVKPDPDEGFGGSATTQLRSSWLQRKCKDTEVDVRIVDDEVTIKLVQRKKINCLLAVTRTLDDLQLDLRHVAGGHVGDYYSYLYNSKICEGSSVYARVIADKLIEVVERQYAAASVSIAPTTSY